MGMGSGLGGLSLCCDDVWGSCSSKLDSGLMSLGGVGLFCVGGLS